MKPMGMKSPESVYCRSFPNAGEIKELLRMIETREISEITKEFFRMLASLPPEQRLAINLKTLLSLNAIRPVENILVDGLSERERKALVELDSSGVPIRIREIGHGLVNLHEKWKTMRSLGKSFREARAARGQFVPGKPLDGVLGDQEE